MNEVPRYTLVNARTGGPVFNDPFFDNQTVMDCAHGFSAQSLEMILSILREHGKIVVLSANLYNFSLLDELLKALQAKGKT
jgi:hypothetical protein